jgi:hypothetical protein
VRVPGCISAVTEARRVAEVTGERWYDAELLRMSEELASHEGRA